METKDSIKFSCHFYFEASGDSEEAASERGKPAEDGQVVEDDDDDDDALSCNYHGSEGAAEFDGDQESCVEHDDADADADGILEKNGEYGMSYCEDDDDDEMQEQQMKSNVSLDEMEKNRRFWEACLAS